MRNKHGKRDIETRRELTLPTTLCERYGMTPEVPIRIIETRSGLLLIPLTRVPMDADLQKELADWQQLSSTAWDAFPFEENELTDRS